MLATIAAIEVKKTIDERNPPSLFPLVSGSSSLVLSLIKTDPSLSVDPEDTTRGVPC